MTKRRTPWGCARCGVSDGDRDTPRSKLCASCAAMLRAHGQWWCVQCSQARPQGDFPIGYQCAACLKKKGQQWRADHAEDQKRYRHDYYQSNSANLKKYRDEYYANNRAQLLTQKQLYYEGRREEIKSKVRARRPRRRTESIQKEQARQERKHAEYQANERRAARITLVRPILRALELTTAAPLGEVPPLLAADLAPAAGGRLYRPVNGALYELARQWPWDGAPADERMGVSYFLLLRERAEPAYLAHQHTTAASAPAIVEVERRAIPRKVVDHAQTLLRDLAARVSPLTSASLRAALLKPDSQAQRAPEGYPAFVDRILEEARAQGRWYAEQAQAASRCFDLLTLFPEHQAASDLVFTLFCDPWLIYDIRNRLARTISEWDDRPHQQRRRMGKAFAWLTRWDGGFGTSVQPPDDVGGALRRARRILRLSHILGDEQSADLAWPVLTEAFARTRDPLHARLGSAALLASFGFFADAAEVLAGLCVRDRSELAKRLLVEVCWWRDQGEALPWLPPSGDGSRVRRLLARSGDPASASHLESVRRTRAPLLVAATARPKLGAPISQVLGRLSPPLSEHIRLAGLVDWSFLDRAEAFASAPNGLERESWFMHIQPPAEPRRERPGGVASHEDPDDDS